MMEASQNALGQQTHGHTVEVLFVFSCLCFQTSIIDIQLVIMSKNS